MATHKSHLRKPSAGAHFTRVSQTPHELDAPSPHTNFSKLPRTASSSSTATVTTPSQPTLLRLPSSGSHAIPISAIPSPASLRALNPSSPQATPGALSSSNSTSNSSSASPSYFAPQPSSASKDARSPGAGSGTGTRKATALHSGHGLDISRGPPNSLITRGNAHHVARRSQASLSDPPARASTKSQPEPDALVSPVPTKRPRRGSDASQAASNATRAQPQQPQQPQQPMAPSRDGAAEHGPALRQSEEPQTVFKSRFTAPSDADQEDLFIAAAGPARPNGADVSSRAERLRSRIAVRNSRQSFPTTIRTTAPTPVPVPASRLNPDTEAARQKRSSQFTFSSTLRSQKDSPLSPPKPLDASRSRHMDLSPKTSFTSTTVRDKDLSPHQFLSSLNIRRPSYPGSVAQTPTTRTATYRPSNLQYTSSRENPANNPVTPLNTSFESNVSHVDGTESLDSTGPAASVWDELDELKSRIRRIELTGKMPSTSAAVVNKATGDRPRTADTSVTTVSSSPKQVRKPDASPATSNAGAGAQNPNKVHPLLKEALAKAKQHVTPTVYRVLEATAGEAIGLAELAGSVGPQGTLHSASSILGGPSVNDRQVRRKADNICRSLAELCIELCDTKSNYASPALRTPATTGIRRTSAQVNGDSPSIRASIEPESDTIVRSSPSRAMSRIEARRASLHTTKINGIRENSQEPLTPAQHVPTRLGRAGTALQQRTRRPSTNDDEDDDPTLRAPSRAMTDFRDIRQMKRLTRQHSHEPMPELQPSPSIQYSSSVRRSTTANVESTPLPHRESTRRFNFDRPHTNSTTSTAREDAHAHAHPVSSTSISDFKSRLAQPSAKTQYGLSRSSTVTATVGRSSENFSYKRRLRGNSAGE